MTNNRFWILAIAITLSVNIVGFVQLLVPPGSLQTIRIEQYFGFISLALLYCAILISPLTIVFPKFPAKGTIIHARRAIGVSAFYYAFLHTYITFFQQLGGFGGIKYLDRTYSLSLLAGIIALGILAIMTATSRDWIVELMRYKRWKLLHRTVYIASLAILLHVILIGPHYDNGPTALGVITYLAAMFLIVLEILRIRIYFQQRKAAKNA